MEYEIKPLSDEEAELISEKLDKYLAATVPAEPGPFMKSMASKSSP